MKRRMFYLATVLSLVVLFTPLLATARDADSGKKAPKIQVAILLDTSNSMDGLINQARAQLWKIVNDLALAKYDGKRPDLEVGLYEYGNSRLDSKTHWVRMVMPLTTDLDKFSESLFALKTSGGSEYCGAVIAAATRELEWSDDKNSLKMIFVAGNEPFSQGPIAYAESCKAAAGRNITISTIFCGPIETGVATGWQHGAQLADGSFSSIDQNKAVVAVAAPQDKELAELNTKLNDTYCAYGARERREEFAQRQQAQDANAAQSAAGASRIGFKASAQYRNADFDLIDAVNEKKVKLEELKNEELPENLQKLSKEELARYVSDKAAERKAVQEKIQELTKARDAYVASVRKKESGEDGAGLDRAIIESTRQQAQKKNFQYEK
jgi:hypothetical protein